MYSYLSDMSVGFPTFLSFFWAASGQAPPPPPPAPLPPGSGLGVEAAPQVDPDAGPTGPAICWELGQLGL